MLRSVAEWVASSRLLGSGHALNARWRLALERSLLHEIADFTLLSLRHSAGLQHVRLRGDGGR